MAVGARITRFGVTERLLHWAVAALVGVETVTGAFLWAPAFSTLVSRPTATWLHLAAAVGLALAFLLAPLIGDRDALRRAARQVDRFDADDAAWLRGLPRRLLHRRARPAPPQGRFNAGQKLNAALTGGLLAVLALSGALLWQGERDTDWRLEGSVTVHDAATVALLVLVLGHIYLAVLNPATRHALQGMTRGDVDRAWAEHHHATWVAEQGAVDAPRERAVGDGSDAAADRRPARRRGAGRDR